MDDHVGLLARALPYLSILNTEAAEQLVRSVSSNLVRSLAIKSQQELVDLIAEIKEVIGQHEPDPT